MRDGVENWDNLLNFLPNSVFYGQRPSVWWTKRHDIDLIVGTYKYGYANYQIMRSDTKLSFHKLESGTLSAIIFSAVESSFQEFPNADTITRRLKKLILTIVKDQHNLQKLNFTAPAAAESEPTGWSLSEKRHILELVTDFGVPITAEGKSDWVQLREKLSQRIASLPPEERAAEEEEKEKEKGEANVGEKGVQLLEKFVQRLRIYSQQILENPGDNTKFDPDSDGFEVNKEEAGKLYRRINLFIFIRKHILAANSKIFQNGLPMLAEDLEKHRAEKHPHLPANWAPAVHDKYRDTSQSE